MCHIRNRLQYSPSSISVYLSLKNDLLLKYGHAHGFSHSFDPSNSISVGDVPGVHARNDEIDLAHFEVVPEPGTILLLGTGLIGLGLQRRHRVL